MDVRHSNGRFGFALRISCAIAKSFSHQNVAKQNRELTHHNNARMVTFRTKKVLALYLPAAQRR
jgi:hypothetical protein